MAEPISNSSVLNNKKIIVPAAKEYLNGNTFAWAMGPSDNDIFQVKMDQKKGIGDTMHFSLREAFDPDNVVTGASQVRGQESDLVFRDDSVVVDEVNHAGKIERWKLTDVRTPLATLNALKPQVLDQAAERLRNDLIDSAALTASPVRNRVLFGATDANYDATLATGLATVDATTDKMSPSMIKIARRKALNVAGVSNGVTNRKMRPFKVKMDNGALVETYVLFVAPSAADQLMEDSDFKDLRDDTRRNAISIPFFNGSKFLGEAHGVLVYEIEELERIKHAGAGAAGIDVAHSLLCGAQAFGVGIADPGTFAEERDDFDRHRAINYGIIRGIKMLKFSDGTNDVENGVVHLYTADVFV